MKRKLLALLLLTASAMFSQSYEKQWENVIGYEAEGLIKSAFASADSIYLRAKKENNEPQLLKAFFFRAKYMQALEEDAQLKIVSNLQEDMKSVGVATRSVMQSIYAEILDEWYYQNGYKISEKMVKEPVNDNFLTWNKQYFSNEIKKAYAASIEERELLYNTPLEKYKPVLDVSPLLRTKDKSLYDFLAERSIMDKYSYVNYNDKSLLKPQMLLLLGKREKFSQLVIPDSLGDNLKNKIKLFKDIEKYYSSKNDTSSLYRAILRRLEYMQSHILYEDQDTYKETLYELIKGWGQHYYTYNAKLLLAQELHDKADKKTKKDYHIKSLALCNDIIGNSKYNDIGNEALILKNNIVNEKLRITVQSDVIADKPILAQVEFKNIDSIRIRVFRIPHLLDFEYNDSFEDMVNARTPYLEKDFALPKKNDYFDYTTEIVIPQLPVGTYIIAATTVKPDTKTYNYLALQSTKLALKAFKYKNTTTYKVVDRETGGPVTEAQAFVEGKRLKIRNGQFKLTGKKNESLKRDLMSENILICYKGDTLSANWDNRYYSDYGNDENETFVANAQLFTDRAIYRPGQTVFFKGIVTKYLRRKYSVVPNIYVYVEVNDQSGETIKTFRLKTNEFGSFADEFKLPQNTMTGRFSIGVYEDSEAEKDENYNKRLDEHPFWNRVDFQYSDISFNVEEYKRPTFEVVLNDMKEDVIINQKTMVTGIARSFSGSSVSGAKVKFRITRQSFLTKGIYNLGNNIEIAKGETVTDDKGNFNIDFTALPDEQADKGSLPFFVYSVQAVITDINGETREGVGKVKAAYHSLVLGLTLPDIIKENDSPRISLDSKNINGLFRAVEGKVIIYRIKESNRPLGQRPWIEPEIQTIAREDFEKMFPSIPYGNKDAPERGEIVLSKGVNTANMDGFTLENFSDWESGRYIASFTAKDKSGNDIEGVKIFTLINKDNISLPGNAVFDYKVVNKDTYIKDRFVTIELFSSLPVVYLNAVMDKGDVFDERELVVKGGRGTITFPLKRNMTDNIFIGFNFIWLNHFYERTFGLTMAEEEKPLNFSTEVIKNKLLPSSNETWSFKLSGEDLPAEVLASMYDKSLDNFVTGKWDFERPYGRGNYDDIRPWMVNNYKHSILMASNFFQSFHYKIYEHKLNTFGFNINRSRNIYYLQKLTGNQNREGEIISGVVLDRQGLPIPGVNVMIEGSGLGVQTDFDGVFTIPAFKGQKLQFTYVGMAAKTIEVQDKIISIILEDDAMLLEDVVVEAYRTTPTILQSKGDYVIIENNNPEYFIRTLQGQVPGLKISTGSGQPGAASTVILRGVSSISSNVIEPLYIIDGIPLSADAFKTLAVDNISSVSVLKDAAATSIYGNRGANGVIIVNTKSAAKEIESLQNVKTRKNFNETAFFYPQLKTDKKGNVSFSFTTPEALTAWKLRLMAHDKNAASGYFENTFVTQKDLMIAPNMPRFLRERDTITLTAKVTNLTDEPKKGNALLQLFDAVTMESVDSRMLNMENIKPFDVPAKGIVAVSWKVTVPKGIQGVQYKVVAKSGDFTDGEENILPVLPNAITVTESIPLWVKPNSSRMYSFKGFDESLANSNINQIGLTLEYTSNPAWTALQSLPYLMEFEHECAEQVFSRYYSNAIAAHMLNSNPKIAEVFNRWRNSGKPVSKFEQNQELKSILLAETPWLLENQNSEEIKSRLSLLFDMEKLAGAQESAFAKLQNKQLAGGGFPWFEGGQVNGYITRHIVAGFGRLEEMGVDIGDEKEADEMVKKALEYIDAEFVADFNRDTETKNYRRNVVSIVALDYLYARSFYLEGVVMTDSLKKAVNFRLDALLKHEMGNKVAWLGYSLCQKAQAAIVLHRFGKTDEAKKIIRHLKETSVLNEDWGMYWLENKAGWLWHQAPVETQVLLIEAFSEIEGDAAAIDALKVWLLKNKQNKNWPTTKATAGAVYALLMQGNDWLSVKGNTAFTFGNQKKPDSKIAESGIEADTGYLKLQWKPAEIEKGMGTMIVENKSSVPGFGGFYWQRSYEEADKDYVPSQTGINIKKQLYLKNTDKSDGELKAVDKNTSLHIGDLITVRLVVQLTEDMEYLHLKDMRAAGFEPVDVISGRKYNLGVSYYQSTRDVATHFFIDRLEKGVYTLEYDVRVNNAGDFSNGIATVQSMYAPEFSGNSKAMRLHVE